MEEVFEIRRMKKILSNSLKKRRWPTARPAREFVFILLFA